VLRLVKFSARVGRSAGTSVPDGEPRLSDFLGGVAVGFQSFARAVDEVLIEQRSVGDVPRHGVGSHQDVPQEDVDNLVRHRRLVSRWRLLSGDGCRLHEAFASVWRKPACAEPLSQCLGWISDVRRARRLFWSDAGYCLGGKPEGSGPFMPMLLGSCGLLAAELSAGAGPTLAGPSPGADPPTESCACVVLRIFGWPPDAGV
jgi:hypothetical protein